MGRLFNSKQFRNDLSLSGSFSGSFQGDGSLLANIGGGIPAISASYAITASYAISASHEIIKEISSSHANTADTASYISPLRQDVHLTGSLYITGSGNISLTSGSAFSITEPDSDQQGRLDFSFTNGDPILEVGSRSNIAYLNLRKGFTGDAFKIGSDGTFAVDGTTTIQLNSSQFKPNTTNTIDLGVFNRRFKDVFLYSGAKLGWSANTAADLIGFQHVAGTNQLQVTGSAAGIRLDVKGTVSASLFSGSFQGNGSGLTNIPATGITGLNLSQIASGSATASIAPDKGFHVNTNTNISGSLTISGSHNSDILLPNAPTNAIRISGSNDRTRLHIYDSVENSTPVYTEGAGIVLTGGDAGSQATLELSAVGSGNGGGNNEQSYIHSNQMITLTGADNDAGYHVKLAGAFGGMFLTANTSNTIGHFYSNGGGTPAGIRLGQVNWAHIKSTGNAAYVKIGKNDTEDWQDINNTRTIFSGNISGSTTSTSSFGTYLGDGSQLTGIGGAFGISNSSGSYTYYTSLSASMAAASSGDVVEVFADTLISGSVSEAVTILLKNGVNIQGNGHSYTLDHSSSIAAFADYLSTETSGTSISSSIHNLRIDRINGDSSTGLRAATFFINNDTANHDTFLDLRGSEISNNAGATYFCSYKHGRVLGGKFIGNHSGAYFLSAAQVQSTGTHNLTDVYCESEDGYAQVDDASNSTFVSKNNTAALVTQGDFVGCTFVSNASSPSQNGAAVTQVGSISGAKLKNCNIWCNGSGTTAVYGVAWIENCSIVNARYFSLNYAIDTGGAGSFTLLNSSVYSNAGSAIKVQDGGTTGALRILNNTIHNDRYSTYGAYPTIYLQGWDNDDTLIANNSIYHDGPYKAGDLANAIEVHSGGGSNYTFNIINNTIKVNQYDAFCISSSAAVAPNIIYAQNTFEGANVPVAPSITQALTNVPDEQGNIHVTSSLNNSRTYSGSFSGSYVGDGSGLTGITSGIFHQTGSYYATTNALQITGSLLVTGSITGVQGVINSLTASYSITSSHAVSASYVNIESLPLVNPIVKYYNVTEITSSGTIVPLPDSLTYVSSSVYEYLEVYINGLRLRYDMDFLPTSNTSIKYLVSIPEGSEITYKSLKRP